ncbi:uncharacterized protein METZ01_LOCUS280476, partial [marine metagenome]
MRAVNATVALMRVDVVVRTHVRVLVSLTA